MKPTIDTVRCLYKINSSEIRGLARYSPDRDAKLDELCRDRAFWLGDRWSLPASKGAQAALLVIRDRRRSDPLAMMERARDKIPAEQLKVFLRLKVGCRSLWTGSKAVLP